MAAGVTGIAHALPPATLDQQGLWDAHFAERYGHDDRAAAIWRHTGVVSRRGVADPRVDDVSAWSTGQRMQRFVDEALPLGKEAVGAALADAGWHGDDADALTVVSCTGYTTPGLDVLIARDLGFPTATERLHVGHMGCYAALPALATAADAARARRRRSVVVCVELTSLHVQPVPPGPIDYQQVVAHALFADAAAAVTIEPGAGLEIVDVAARTDTRHAELMTWDVTDVGFRMGLSPDVPGVLGEHVGATVADLCARNGVEVDEVAAWAVHPGGPRIVDVVVDRLGLDESQVADSRAVLAEHGNCSSATVLMILERIARRELPSGAPVVAMAFGPGLSLHAALLRIG